ncbi:hypothetical protein BDR07DRAFT_1612178 [Suillus spraguei]|nr:hypothetical protein BDR07DRAFT_1612178 [Suillus spraguei]
MACIQNQHTYTFKNCKGGTVMDLSGGDNYSIIGYHDDNGPNQAWTFQNNGDHWVIKSAGADKYLGIEGDVDGAADGAKVVAVSSPAKWDINDSDVQGVQGIRILLHGKQFSVDLSTTEMRQKAHQSNFGPGGAVPIRFGRLSSANSILFHLTTS